jgi:hypothetical protein
MMNMVQRAINWHFGSLLGASPFMSRVSSLLQQRVIRDVASLGELGFFHTYNIVNERNNSNYCNPKNGVASRTVILGFVGRD